MYLPMNGFDTGLFLLEKYAVLIPNYQGSAGFGLDFCKKTLKSAGTLEIEDLIDLIDLTLKNYGNKLDSERIATTGYSYGGFASSWLAVHPWMCDRLKVSVPINAVTYLPDMISNSDIPDWVFAECNLSHS